MVNHDWTKFSKRVPVKASVKEVYRLLSSRQGMETWFLRMAEFIKPDKQLRDPASEIQQGDTYRWLWHGYGDESLEKGRIVEANGHDTIRFTFAGECLVTIRASDKDGTTLIEISQENIPTDEKSKINIYLGCAEGWAFYLVNLKSILEGGLDLRNRDETIKGVLNS